MTTEIIVIASLWPVFIALWAREYAPNKFPRCVYDAVIIGGIGVVLSISFWMFCTSMHMWSGM